MDEKVWVPSDEEGYVIAKIVGDGKIPGTVRVRLDSGKEVEFARKLIEPINTSTLSPVDDLIKLDQISEAIILHNIRQRYAEDIIYTFIGPMVVSVNPFRRLEKYGEHLIPKYAVSRTRDGMMPHLYTIAQEAYKALEFGKSQSVIISGESGAGKTEATKIILKYLCDVSEQKGNSVSVLARSILATNPILEAFGNAKTIRNNNSSRFGKFIRVLFNNSGSIIGAKIDNYLLENTRIIFQAPEERNYHIFYQLVKGASPEERRKYELLQAKDYHYLTNGDTEAPGIDDVAWFNATKEAFNVLGVTLEEQTEIFRLVSGILALGNVNFSGEESVILADRYQIQRVGRLLAVSDFVLSEALTKRYFGGGGRTSTYSIPLSKAQAIENRDALTKELYSKLFDYLVSRLNIALIGNSNKEPLFNFIGVLDIYGFEIFAQNSLEQFCINFTNEKLHLQFNQHMFKAEQEEYEKENVPWEKITYHDNQGCIELIEKTGIGILALLDEEIRLPKGTDEALLEKLAQKHKPNSWFHYNPIHLNKFSIHHFAGTVSYTIDGFINKNKNTLNADVSRAMATSTLPIVADIFMSPKEEEMEKGISGKFRKNNLRQRAIVRRETTNSNKTTVTQKFKKELGDLVLLLEKSERHYIRCIKPNDSKLAGDFRPNKVLAQLRSNGVMETVRLRKAGYAQKTPPLNFYLRYKFLGVSSPDKVAEFLGTYTDDDSWAIGKSKIFLKGHLVEKLEDDRQSLLRGVVIVLQRFIRGYFAKQIFEELLEQERKRREEEERRRREEEERLRRLEEERLRKIEEERKRKEEEERRKREEEERRRLAEEERKRQQLELLRKQQEERERRIEEMRKEHEERERREEEERIRREREATRLREEREKERLRELENERQRRILQENENEKKRETARNRILEKRHMFEQKSTESAEESNTENIPPIVHKPAPPKVNNKFVALKALWESTAGKTPENEEVSSQKSTVEKYRREAEEKKRKKDREELLLRDLQGDNEQPNQTDIYQTEPHSMEKRNFELYMENDLSEIEKQIEEDRLLLQREAIIQHNAKLLLEEESLSNNPVQDYSLLGFDSNIDSQNWSTEFKNDISQLIDDLDSPNNFTENEINYENDYDYDYDAPDDLINFGINKEDDEKFQETMSNMITDLKADLGEAEFEEIQQISKLKVEDGDVLDPDFQSALSEIVEDLMEDAIKELEVDIPDIREPLPYKQLELGYGKFDYDDDVSENSDDYKDDEEIGMYSLSDIDSEIFDVDGMAEDFHLGQNFLHKFNPVDFNENEATQVPSIGNFNYGNMNSEKIEKNGIPEFNFDTYEDFQEVNFDAEVDKYEVHSYDAAKHLPRKSPFSFVNIPLHVRNSNNKSRSSSIHNSNKSRSSSIVRNSKKSRASSNKRDSQFSATYVPSEDSESAADSDEEYSDDIDSDLRIDQSEFTTIMANLSKDKLPSGSEDEGSSEESTENESDTNEDDDSYHSDDNDPGQNEYSPKLSTERGSERVHNPYMDNDIENVLIDLENSFNESRKLSTLEENLEWDFNLSDDE